MSDLLDHLLADAPPVSAEQDGPSLRAWWDRHEQIRARFPNTIDLAVAAGFAADRVAFAFASGYAAALTRVDAVAADAPTALCITEAEGNRPRDIHAALTAEGEHFRLSGEKTFVTLGEQAESLWIAARMGADENAAARPKIRVVRVPASRVGITLEARPTTPFVPEIPHARVKLAGVRVEASEFIPGDGYLGVVKPFRTLEDTHVHAAVLGLLIRFGRLHEWPHHAIERLLMSVLALRSIGEREPLDPRAHIALAGVLDHFGRFLDGELPSLAERLPEADRERLFRDAPLFSIAQSVRKKRRLTAWAQLAGR